VEPELGSMDRVPPFHLRAGRTLHTLLLMRALRRDRFLAAAARFVRAVFGPEFAERPNRTSLADLAQVSSCSTGPPKARTRG